jgi:hypothetical protein
MGGESGQNSVYRKAAKVAKGRKEYSHGVPGLAFRLLHRFCPAIFQSLCVPLRPLRLCGEKSDIPAHLPVTRIP